MINVSEKLTERLRVVQFVTSHPQSNETLAWCDTRTLDIFQSLKTVETDEVPLLISQLTLRGAAFINDV